MSVIIGQRGVDVSDDKDSDNDSDNDNHNCNHNNDDNIVAGDKDVVFVGLTDVKAWRQIIDDSRATLRHINPIPYTPRNGDGAFSDVNIFKKYWKDLNDENSDLRYYKFHEWSLPRFGRERYWEWIAAHTKLYDEDCVT